MFSCIKSIISLICIIPPRFFNYENNLTPFPYHLLLLCDSFSKNTYIRVKDNFCLIFQIAFILRRSLSHKVHDFNTIQNCFPLLCCDCQTRMPFSMESKKKAERKDKQIVLSFIFASFTYGTHHIVVQVYSTFRIIV